jgi:hypothetical protein
MSDDGEHLLGRLIDGDPTAVGEIRDRAATWTPSPAPRVLVAAALVGDRADALLVRALASATTSRDRQLVAIATAHLDGHDELVEVLVRDHLVDHPGDGFVTWIASHR